MRLALKLAAIAFILTACSPAQLLTNAIKPSGANVLANGQAGAINSQTVGKTVSKPILRPEAGRDVVQSEDKAEVIAEAIEQVSVTNQTDPKMFALFLFLFIAWSYLLWKLPSPDQIKWKRSPP